MFNFLKRKPEVIDENQVQFEYADEEEIETEVAEPELTAEQKLAIVEATLKAAEERISKLEEQAKKDKEYVDKLEGLNSKLVAQIKTFEGAVKANQKKDAEGVAIDRNNNLSSVIKDLKDKLDVASVKTKITCKNAKEAIAKLEKITGTKLDSSEKIALSGAKAVIAKIVDRFEK